MNRRSKRRVDATRHIKNYDNPHRVTLGQLGVDEDKLRKVLNSVDKDNDVDGEWYVRGDDVFFGKGTFTDNVIAYAEGEGAQSAEDVYSVGELRFTDSPKLYARGANVFDTENTTTHYIDASWIRGGDFGGDNIVTSFGPSGGSRRSGDVVTQLGDYESFYVNLTGDTMSGTLFNTQNIVAYHAGTGATSSPDTYGVGQLNVSGNIAYKTVDIFDGNDKIKEQFLSDSVTDGGVTSFGPIGDQRTGDVVPKSTDYDAFYALRTVDITVAGTTNQVQVAGSNPQDLTGDLQWTLGTPQNIHTTADVIFGSGRFHNNVTAYYQGTGATSSPDTYSVGQLNVSGNIAFKTVDIFDSSDVIKNQFLPSDLGTDSGVTEWGPIGNKRDGSVSPAAGDYHFNQLSGDLALNQIDQGGASNGQVLEWNNSSGSWAPATISIPVTSVFGRTGAITAQAGDYSSFYVPLGRTLTMSGTSNQVNVSGGTQSLGANRTWTFGTPQDIDTDADVEFNSGTFHQNVIAYSEGSGATSSPDTYDVGQLNVSGNIALKTVDIFDGNDIIKDQFLPSDLGSTSGVTEWGPIGNKRDGSVVPAAGDYNFNQLSGTASSGQLPSTVVYEDGTSYNIRATATTKGDVGLGNLINTLDLSQYDNSTSGFLTSFTETDPTVPSHVKNITTGQKSEWNTAYDRSPTGLSGNGDGVLTLTKQDGSTETTNLAHSHSEYVETGSNADLNTLLISGPNPWITVGTEDSPLRFYHDANDSVGVTDNAYEWYSGESTGTTNDSLTIMKLQHRGKLIVEHDVQARNFIV